VCQGGDIAKETVVAKKNRVENGRTSEGLKDLPDHEWGISNRQGRKRPGRCSLLVPSNEGKKREGLKGRGEVTNSPGRERR